MSAKKSNENYVLSKEEMALLPSDDDVKQYEEHGWYQSKKIISDKMISSALMGVDKFYSGQFDFNLKSYDGIANDPVNPEAVIKNNEFVTLQVKELQELGFYPLLSAVAAKLSRSKQIRLFSDSLITKKPAQKTNKGIVGWHSDKAYWPTCISSNMLTAWIPLQDCTIEMGPVVYIDKSNHWYKEEELKSFFSFNNQNLESFEDFLSKFKKGHKKVPMAVKKGQVCFHNCHTIHSSYPNVSNVDRIALAMHLQDDSNEYQKAYDKNGALIVIGYDKLAGKDEHGNPNYHDENLFPILWSDNS
jgi:ectoine hydroxylase-related dioxygenase (phytanoyl-CoA dioxygenase family)